MDIRGLDNVLIDTTQTVDTDALLGRRIGDVPLASLITAAATQMAERPAGDVDVSLTIQEEPTYGDCEFI